MERAAFDAAWAEIADNFGNDPRTIDVARLWLANAMLSIACEDSRNVEVLKRAALERMARDTEPLHCHLAGDLPRKIVRGSPHGDPRRSSSPPAESQGAHGGQDREPHLAG